VFFFYFFLHPFILNKMSFKAATLFLLFALFCIVASSLQIQSSPETLLKFAQYQEDFQRSYASEEEESHRYSVFLENLNKIETLKDLNPEAVFGPGPYADRTSQEFAIMFASPIPKAQTIQHLRGIPVYAAPVDVENQDPEVTGTFDWRDKGIVSAIKNQGQCGSCWAFASVEIVESAWAIKHGQLEVLSPQQILDCSNAGDCGGGYLSSALAYTTARNITSGMSYPYQGTSGTCQSVAKADVLMSNVLNIAPSDKDANIAAAVKNYGPVAFGIWGDLSVLQNYQSGVLSMCPAGNDGHFMVVVGWQDLNGTPVWIVRNSWSTGWGMDGYVYFKRKQNTCAMYDYVLAVRSK